MRPFLALVTTDLRLFFMDRRAVLMSVVAPIVIASFFGFVFGGDGDSKSVSRVAVALVDEDGSQISRALGARLAADQALSVVSLPLNQAREDVRRARRVAAIHLPAGFGAAAASAFFGGGPKAPLNLLYDPSHATEAAMIEGLIAGRVMETVSKEMFSGPMGRQAVRDSIPEVEHSTAIAPNQKDALLTLLRGIQGWNDAAGTGAATGLQGGMTIPYELKKAAVTSSSRTPYNAYAHAFAGMGVQFILFMGIEMGVGLLAQRRQGMWKRLRAAPLSRATLLGSRAASTALISLFILACLFLFAGLVFGVRISGSLVGFVGICAGFSLMTAAFGLLLAGLGKTPEGTRGISIVVTLLLVMLGGAWVPTFVFPAWMQRLTLVVPTRWAIDGLDGTTWRGLGFSEVAVAIACLTLTALICGALAVARFRWETE
jgi:ABC-2 type transport system permease protein